MSGVIWKGSTTNIVLGKEQILTDGISGETITNATVTAYLYNESVDATVDIGTFLMSHVPSEQSGRYRASIPYDQAGINVGDRCRVEIFADAGSGKRLTIVLKATVKMRTG